MEPPEPDLPPVFTRADALAAGLTRHQIEHRIGRDWQPLRRGAYCLAPAWAAASPAGRHLLCAAAVTLTHPGDPSLTLSHLTAAVVWDLPVPATITWPICLTAHPGHRRPRTDRLSAGARRPVRIQVATLRAGDRVRVRGLWATSPARTAADCLRHCEPGVAVPIADAVLRRRLAAAGELEDAVAAQSTWPLAARARRSLRLVTGAGPRATAPGQPAVHPELPELGQPRGPSSQPPSSEPPSSQRPGSQRPWRR